jgi:methionyl aminopeptidase
MIYLKSESEISIMRQANHIVAETLDLLESEIKPGVTTHYLDKICEEFILKNNAKPAFKGYNGFPNALCISVNDEIVHGMPGTRVLRNGDIVSCDVGTYYNGFYGDAARTFPVNGISEEAERLIKVTRESLMIGIREAKSGNRLYDISHAIQTHVEKNGFAIVKVFVGHGVGRQLHEDPQIPNYGKPGRGVKLRDGMVLALEPMVNVGRPEVKILEDGWTAVTEDGTLSAHFEHSIAIRNGEAEILSVA